MKEFYKNIKNSKRTTQLLMMATGLALSFLCWSAPASAAPVAIVKDLSGKAFILIDSKTQTLKIGDLVEDMSEIITEDGAQITFNDYYNHIYHLAGGGHVQIMRRLIDLRSGHLWVQTKGDGGVSLIQTANAKVSYTIGEAIVSYDSGSGKTQVLSVRGQFDMCNQLLEDVTVAVSEGHFSFIQKDIDNGVPRNPTPIGVESYKKVTSLFVGVDPLSQTMTTPSTSAAPNRAPASMPTEAVAPVKVSEQRPATAPVEAVAPGEVVYIQKEAPVQAREVDTKALLAQKLAEAKRIAPKKVWHRENEYKHLSGVKVTIYGVGGKGQNRAPASVEPVRATKDAGDGSLTDKYKQQMRHEEEVNRLIDQLKNYDRQQKNN